MGTAEGYKRPTHGIFRIIPNSWVPYAELMRLDRQSGFLAFYWHYLIGLGFSINAHPLSTSIGLSKLCFLVMYLGLWTTVFRGITCTWNDNLDQAFDRQVARCRTRPIPRGAVSTFQAHLFTMAQVAAGACILSPFQGAVLTHATINGILLFIYPLLKRFTDFPQVELGFGLSYPVFTVASMLGKDPLAPLFDHSIGFSARLSKVAESSLACSAGYLYVAGVFWCIIFDTVYAHQDYEDDLKAGVRGLAATLLQLQAASVSYTAKTPGAREKLISLSRDLISNLELPSEALMRMGCAEPAAMANCRIATDLMIFVHLRDSGGTGITTKDLAAKCGADPALISRIMKHLAAMNVISQKGEDEYCSTPLAEALAEVKYRDGIIFLHDVAGASFRYLPKYIKKTSYRLPADVTNGPFQAAHKTELSAYSWLDQNPPYIQVFNNYMSGYRAGKPAWFDPGFYPVADRLIKGFNSNFSSTFIVDIGGGKGHDLIELKLKHPSIPGRLILQDRPALISTLRSSDFEAMSHDFFTAQPIKHARAYFLHSILHNWSDDDCIRILQQLRPAMKLGYSRLLLNEIVVPRRHAAWPTTSMDQLMLVLAAVQERTEIQFAELLKQAGFNLVKVYSYELGQESLIEAEVDE
ncbi:hypothetical protein GQX73_g1674 [Xylaria multiplex]|uniref:Uncharacterized protein n=1 Tax=Xylaria multiplex TaxID=323545 RepID=A0A7C8IVB8_9PEZI|nr:hypothetical protein GQX73_g1674 [Xylaria multiplex]